MMTNIQPILIFRMPRQKKIDLNDLASWLKLTPPQCAKFFGYTRNHWTDMKNGVQEIPDRLRYSVEAHEQLSAEEIEAMKQRRL